MLEDAVEQPEERKEPREDATGPEQKEQAAEPKFDYADAKESKGLNQTLNKEGSTVQDPNIRSSVAEEEEKKEDNGPDMELVKVTVKFARDLVRQIESERAEREEIENPRHPAPAKMTVTKDVSRRNRAKYERKVVENAVGDGKRVEETLRVVFLRPKITEEVQNNALKYT